MKKKTVNKKKKAVNKKKKAARAPKTTISGNERFVICKWLEDESSRIHSERPKRHEVVSEIEEKFNVKINDSILSSCWSMIGNRSWPRGGNETFESGVMTKIECITSCLDLIIGELFHPSDAEFAREVLRGNAEHKPKSEEHDHE